MQYASYTIWINSRSMLCSFSSFVHRIHVHPASPGLLPPIPNEIIVLATYFQSIATAVLEIYYRGNKPSHELKVVPN